MEAHSHIYMSEQTRLPTKPFDDFTNSEELAIIGEVPTISSIKTIHDSFFSGNFKYITHSENENTFNEKHFSCEVSNIK